MSATFVVLDASVGAKWFRDEPGSAAARDILDRHGDGDVRIVVPVIFMHEVLDVARRRLGTDAARRLLAKLERESLIIAGADADFLRHALDVCERLDCTVYDAAAPALAELLDAQLVSADPRAHGGFPGVRIIG